MTILPLSREWQIIDFLPLDCYIRLILFRCHGR